MPHPPFFSEENFIDNYSADKVKLDDSYYQEDFSSKPDFIREHAMDGSHGVPSEEKLRKELAQYYSMIEATDDHFGRVINGLKEKLDWDNTIVLLIADHGDMMGAHKMRMKGTLPYEELYRIPCLLKLPKHINSSRSEIDDLVDSPGFAASLLQLAGIDIPETFHAPCLAEAIARDRAPDDDHAFFEHYGAYWGIHPFYGIRTRKYKLINYFGDDDCLEFYDLEADPLELHNKADDPAYAAVVTELNGKATDWWEKTNGRDAAFYESDAFKEKGKAAF